MLNLLDKALTKEELVCRETLTNHRVKETLINLICPHLYIKPLFVIFLYFLHSVLYMSDKTEQALLNLADDFKNQIKTKNKLIIQLKKIILTLYGIVRLAHSHEDILMLDIARTELSEAMTEHFGLEEEESDDESNPTAPFSISVMNVNDL